MFEARCRASGTSQGDVKRAQIVLLAADGRSTRSIAKEVRRSTAHCEQMAAAFFIVLLHKSVAKVEGWAMAILG
jgi:hypothetical protein